MGPQGRPTHQALWILHRFYSLRPPTTCPLHTCPWVSLLSHPPPTPSQAVLSHYLLAQGQHPAPPALANRHPSPICFPLEATETWSSVPSSPQLLSWLVVSTRDHPAQARTHLLHSSPGPGFPPHLGLHLQLGPLQWPLGPTEVCRQGQVPPKRPSCALTAMLLMTQLCWPLPLTHPLVSILAPPHCPWVPGVLYFSTPGLAKSCLHQGPAQTPSALYTGWGLGAQS